MPKGSDALIASRKEEIVSACAQLYENMGFKEITLGDIGKRTSFTRTSIYNYFQTKEEIFLALLQREYEAWISDLEAEMAKQRTLSADALAGMLADTLQRRRCMLKLMSMNLYDMEGNSRMENLVAFKRVYARSMMTVRHPGFSLCLLSVLIRRISLYRGHRKAGSSYGRCAGQLWPLFHPGDHLRICHPAASIIPLAVPFTRKKGFGRDHFVNGPQEALRCLFFLGSLVRSGSGVHEKKCQPNGLTRICLAVLYLRSNVLILLRISARNAAAAAIAMPANSVPCCAGTPVLP